MKAKTLSILAAIEILIALSCIVIGMQINSAATPAGVIDPALQPFKGGTGATTIPGIKSAMFQDSGAKTYLNSLAQPTQLPGPQMTTQTDYSAYVSADKLSIRIPMSALSGVSYLQIWAIRDSSEYGMGTIDLNNLSTTDKYEVIRGTWSGSGYSEWQFAFSYKQSGTNLVVTALIDNRSYVKQSNGTVYPNDMYMTFSGVVKGIRYTTTDKALSTSELNSKMDPQITSRVGSVAVGPSVSGYATVSYSYVAQYGKFVTVNFRYDVNTTIPGTVGDVEPQLFTISGVDSNPISFICAPGMYSIPTGARTYNHAGLGAGTYIVNYTYTVD
jgi:hypothetical protein